MLAQERVMKRLAMPAQKQVRARLAMPARGRAIDQTGQAIHQATGMEKATHYQEIGAIMVRPTLPRWGMLDHRRMLQLGWIHPVHHLWYQQCCMEHHQQEDIHLLREHHRQEDIHLLRDLWE